MSYSLWRGLGGSFFRCLPKHQTKKKKAEKQTFITTGWKPITTAKTQTSNNEKKGKKKNREAKDAKYPILDLDLKDAKYLRISVEKAEKEVGGGAFSSVLLLHGGAGCLSSDRWRQWESLWYWNGVLEIWYERSWYYLRWMRALLLKTGLKWKKRAVEQGIKRRATRVIALNVGPDIYIELFTKIPLKTEL